MCRPDCLYEVFSAVVGELPFIWTYLAISTMLFDSQSGLRCTGIAAEHVLNSLRLLIETAYDENRASSATASETKIQLFCKYNSTDFSK